ncbi:MAG: hypothetical protein NVS3B25_07270 [Hymenobacter sp.]
MRPAEEYLHAAQAAPADCSPPLVPQAVALAAITHALRDADRYRTLLLRALRSTASPTPHDPR